MTTATGHTAGATATTVAEPGQAPATTAAESGWEAVPAVTPQGTPAGAVVAVTGWSLHLPAPATGDGPVAEPHRDRPAPSSGRTTGAAGGRAPEPWQAAVADLVAEVAVGADDAGRVLGRKGLLYKEPATRLALVAVHRALGLPVGRTVPERVDPRTAVVACGNLGNVHTVATVAREVREGGVREVSPLAAPNASSNVVASTVALWFGFGGPNLMVCSGATAGLDGLALATRLLRTRRADRVVLVGAEPDDETATAVYGRPLRAGAACALLERLPDQPTGAPSIRAHATTANMAARSGAAAGGGAGEGGAGGDGAAQGGAAGDGVGQGGAGQGGVAAQVGGAAPGALRVGSGGLGFDPVAAWGDVYGANGVVALVVAAAVAAAGWDGDIEVCCGDSHDGWRRATVGRVGS